MKKINRSACFCSKWKTRALLLFMTISKAALAQDSVQITINVSNTPIEQVFRSIEQQTSYTVLYNTRLVNPAEKVSVNVRRASLERTMAEVLKGRELTWSIKGSGILILPKKEQASPLPVKDTVSGKITDSNGNPLAGVTIKVKGSSYGTLSDDRGHFRISVPDDNAVLVVSSIGFIPVQVQVINNKSPEIMLTPATMQIREVEVSTGYQQVAPEQFIGSATVVDSTILERQVGKDLLTRLDGTTNGLMFNKSGGAGVLQIQLRGISTLNNTNDLNGISSQNPLIILDDFPYTGDIRNINPNTIESISVLKDAVATSIWGARAGNGVIVIKSKSGGLNRRFSMTFNSNVSISRKPDVYYFPQMSSSDFIDVEQDLFSKGFYDLHIQFPQFFATSPVVDILAKQRSGDITASEAQAQIDALKAQDVRNDVNRYIFRNAVNKQNFLNISGGSNLVGYNLSLGADNNSSSIQGPGKNNRYTFNSKVQFRPVNPLELSVGVDYSHELSRPDGITYPLSAGGKSILPYARLMDENGNHLAIPTLFGLSYLESLPYDKMPDWQYRPLDERDLVDYRDITNLLRINFGSKVRITPWLSGDIKYQYTRQTLDTRDLKNEYTYFTRNLINQYTDPATYKQNIPYGGILDIRSNELSTHNVRGQINVRRNWGGLHDFSALLAGEVSQSRLYGTQQRLYGFNEEVLSTSPNIDYLTNINQFLGGRGRVPNVNGIAERNNNLVSVLANASYTYDSRYGIYISGRRDGSNLFGVNVNNKYKPLWSVGTRWNVSNESFYNLKWLNNLAVRLTYGYAGNINNTISALATISHSSRPNAFGEPYALLGTAPNPDLRWEEVRTINAAVDFELFHGRIAGTAEWYQKKGNDVVAGFPVDPTLGIPSGTLSKNAANLTGKGFDIGIKSQNIKGKFSWITNANLNFSKTVVSKYFVETKSVPNAPIIREGDIYMGIYAYKWAGLDPETGDPRGYIGGETSTNYKGIFQDSLQNQQFIGSLYPLYYGNMMNTFLYKGFSLSINISFRVKYYFKKPTIRYAALYGSWLGHGDFANRWKKPGDETQTNIPSMPYPANANRDNFFENSAINYEKGDHIRLQDIRFSYRWSNGIKRLPFKSAELYSYIGNMNAMIWKASSQKYDPDFPTSSYPPLTTYSFGLNLTL